MALFLSFNVVDALPKVMYSKYSTYKEKEQSCGAVQKSELSLDFQICLFLFLSSFLKPQIPGGLYFLG